MRKRSSFRFRISAVLLVFFATVFLLPAYRDGNPKLYLLAVAVPAAMLLLMLLPARAFSIDRPSISAALSLCGFGLIAAMAANPDEAVSQGFRSVAALFFLASGIVLVRAFRPSVLAAALPAFCGFGMISCFLWFPDLSVSLAEGGMALLLFSLSAFVAMRLRLPALVIVLGGTLLLLLQRDYGNAAVCGITCVLVFWAASGSALWSGILLCCTGGLFGVFFGFSGLPAESTVSSMLPRIAAMPLIPPESVPEEHVVSSPDSLFFLLGERYGIVFLFCAVMLVILILVHGSSLAQHTRKTLHASLALGVVLLIGLRLLLFLAVSAGLIPLLPGSFPFLTSSLPDLFTHFFLLGLLSGISSRNETDLDEDARLAMLAR